MKKIKFLKMFVLAITVGGCIGIINASAMEKRDKSTSYSRYYVKRFLLPPEERQFDADIKETVRNIEYTFMFHKNFHSQIKFVGENRELTNEEEEKVLKCMEYLKYKLTDIASNYKVICNNVEAAGRCMDLINEIKSYLTTHKSLPIDKRNIKEKHLNDFVIKKILIEETYKPELKFSEPSSFDDFAFPNDFSDTLEAENELISLLSNKHLENSEQSKSKQIAKIKKAIGEIKKDFKKRRNSF